MQENNEVTILFGSGADTDCYKELPSGQEFVEDLFSDSFYKERKMILGEECAKFTLIYPQSRNIFLQTIYENKDRKDDWIAKVKDDVIAYYLKKENKPKEDKIGKYCSKWYKYITEYVASQQDTDKETKEESHSQIAEFFLNNAVFFDTIDEKFNSLRKPQEEGNNPRIKRVKNAYLTIYLSIFKKLYSIPENFEWNYVNIINKLQDDYDITGQNKTYYSLVKDTGKIFNIITTNYTKLAEKYTGQDVVYLHGKMTWFEDLKNLTIYDCDNENEKKKALEIAGKEENVKNLMPFIMIPSGVKPIISAKQIMQFAKFIEKLNRSKYLCVVGYRFNSEDNHINSIIADWLRNDNHKMFYFNYNESLSFKDLIWTKEFDIDYDFDGSFDKLTQIMNVKINDKDNEEKFANIIGKL